MDKTVKDTESIDAIAAYKKQSSDHIKRMSRTAPPAAIQAPERQHLATKGRQHRFSDSRVHALPHKTWKWWSKHHRPQSLTEGGPQSVGGSHSSGCSQQNLKRTWEKAGQEGAITKSGKRPAKESTLDELVAFALEGTSYVKEEPEEEPPSLFK